MPSEDEPTSNTGPKWDGDVNENWVEKPEADEDFVIKATDHLSSLEQTFLGYDDPGVAKAVEECARHHIRFKDLVTLDDEDLKLLGVKYPATREQMLNDFANFPEQGQSYEKFMKNMNADEYMEAVLQNISAHLWNIQTSMCAAQIQLEVTPLEDPILEDTKMCGSEMTLKVIERMLQQCGSIETTIQAILEKDAVEKVSSASGWYIGAFAIGALGVGLYKYLRMK